MPSASNGRYRSRLFNFLNRQSLRLTEQFDRTVRHVKVAADWGVQILLYPAYLLVQTSLSVGRQLASEAEAGWPRLKEFTNKEHQETPPAADTPIQRVLEELKVGRLKVESFPALNVAENTAITSSDVNLQLSTFQPSTLQPSTSQPSTFQPSTPQPSTFQPSTQTDECCVIQGVASLLGTRSLVLVTVENQILDILTPQQQQKLASKISWEVADLRRQWRLAEASNLEKASPRLSTLDRPRVFLPMRLFWQVMAWEQTSPVAIAANVFQESALVTGEIPSSGQILPRRHAPKLRRQLPASNNSVIPNKLASRGVIAFLDRTAADLESHQLVPGTEALISLRDSLQDRWNSSPLAKVSIQNSIPNVIPIAPNSQRSLSEEEPRVSQDPAAATEASQTHSFQIQALIYAAIDYFFGRRGSNLSGTDSQEQAAIQANRQGEVHQLSGRYAPSLSPGQSSQNLELADAGEPDPWLSWGDLYGNPDNPDYIAHHTDFSQELEPKIPNRKSQAQLPETFNSKMPVKPGNSVRDVLKRFLNPKQAPGKLSTRSTKKHTVEPHQSVAQTGKLTTTQKTAPWATQNENKGRIATKGKTPSSVAPASRQSRSVSPAGKESKAIATPSSSSQDTKIEPAPDWIETKATPTGYVKHPLERVLEWLDLTMLWLEELVVKVWRWVRQRRR